MNSTSNSINSSAAPSKPKLLLSAILSVMTASLPVSHSYAQTDPVVQQKTLSQVALYTFQNGLPMSGVSVFLADKKLGTTNRDGVLNFKLPTGTQTLTLKDQKSSLITLKVKVTEGDDIELVIPITEKAKVSKVLAQSAKTETVIQNEDNGSPQAEADNSDKAEDTQIPTVTGIIEGNIYSFMTGEVVPDVSIYLTGIQQEIKTDQDGYFKAKVPIGNYSMSVIHPDYSSMTLQGLTVKKDQAVFQELELTPAAAELEEFVVTAPAIEGGILALMDEKQNTSGVAEVISAEEFSKSGDSSAASALSRVTGLTLVGGKYIYVRGMGDRYSSTRLNHAGLPSPEPAKRVIPLDMFPTGMIGSIVVQKTYSPDLPGAFGGGTVLMRTKPIPLGKKRKISVSTGGNSQSTFQTGMDYEGGEWDSIGMDTGSRDLPSGAESYIKNPPGRFDPDRDQDQELYDIAQGMPNNYKVSSAELRPDFGIKLNMGDRYEAYSGNSGWGYNFALNYSRKSRYWEEERKDVAKPSELFSPEKERKYITKYSTNLGLMGSLIYEHGENHKLDATSILSRSSSDTVILDTSYSSDNSNNFKQYSLQWEERQLLSQQFHGTHVFPETNDLELEWQTTLSQATRQSPDTRVYTYQQSANHDEETGQLAPYTFQYRGDGNIRLWEDMEDFATSTTLDLKYPIYDFHGISGLLKSGAMLDTKSRTSDTYKFSWDTSGFRSNPNSDETLESENPEDIFAPENLGVESDQINLKNTTQPTDSYEANQRVRSFYVMSDLQLHKYLKLMAGVRHEFSNQEVKVFTSADRSDSETDKLEDTFVLPAVSLTVPYREGEQVRLAYSKTLNRPDLKELSQSTYIDPDTRDYYTGNPDLQIATIKNLDLRWEKYFNKFENVSVAVFQKDFESPIEVIATPNVTEGLDTYSYANVNEATNRGIEFQTRFWLRRIFGNDIPAFYIDTNFTKIDSSIDLSGVKNILATNQERALQGQSPWVFNLNLGYENLVKEINANLVLNMKGDSIYAAGTKTNPDDDFGVEDTYLVTPPSLDFVYNQRLYWGAEDKLKLKLKLQNLLDGSYQLTINDEIQREYKKGISASLSLSYTWK
ncbi:MAG: TonB-dependent receptor [Hydrogenovibrio sp.]|uniref:TonB-dependent receptor domain-containing protein n=1 Tax=Hydrogenovibrio sp. TaxID=2065821 RepID=UPI00286FFC0F|nr:TonB-dependent receptor [Hydrogenovibrio sp.]MDR9499539.1 TonB-dependent receptor [Hydrogenovibrio sp.]